MSRITPDVSTASDPALAPALIAAGLTTPPAPTFKRPIAPEPNPERDNELLNYYFDGTWTTKDIAEHF